jgi:hypothetical protein
MIDVGWLGSPIDVATFVVVLVALVYDVRPDVANIAAATVALAKEEDGVDGDRVAADLDVDDRDVAQYQRASDDEPKVGRFGS